MKNRHSTAVKTEDAIAVLKEDHMNVKDIFKRFEKAKESEQKELARQAAEELKIHTRIEEEIFYPAVREKMDEDGADLMNEAEEEHHVAKLLIRELEEGGFEGGHFEAKFTVLAENVRHHIKEEETEMFPKVRKLDLDLEELGQRLLIRKEELKRNGFGA